MDDNKLKLEINLAPPLPDRRFLLVCAQKTVKDLKNEIRRRLVTIINGPIALVFDGFELMDDDLVADLLSCRNSLVVVLQEHLQSYYTRNSARPPSRTCECQRLNSRRPPVFISKKEHDTGLSQRQQTPNVNKRVYPAELLYADIKATQSQSTTDITDKSVGKRMAKDSRSKSSTSGSSSSNEATSTSSSNSDVAATCTICDEAIFPLNSEHICSKHASESDDDEPPEEMPLDRLSVSDLSKTRVQNITIPEILWLDDASPKDAHPGHIVAYKTLEIASNVTPVVSNFRIAEIVETHDDGSLSVRILREFRHGKETSNPVDSAAKHRHASLLSNTDSSAESGSTDNNIVLIDPASIYDFKFLHNS